MDTVNFKKQQKIKALAAGLSGDHVLVHLDSRATGVSIPSHLQNQPALTLKLSMLFNGATEYNDTQITSNLKFGTEYYECIIPWDAVWGVTSSTGEQKIWHDDMPKEALGQFIQQPVAAGKRKLKAIISRVFDKKQSDSGKTKKASKSKPSPNERRKMLKVLK